MGGNINSAPDLTRFKPGTVWGGKKMGGNSGAMGGNSGATMLLN